MVGNIRSPGTHLLPIAQCRGPVNVMVLLIQAVNGITSATVTGRACVEAAGGFDEPLPLGHPKGGIPGGSRGQVGLH